MKKSDTSADAARYKEMVAQIARLNEELQTFIRATIETHELQEGESQNLCPNEEALAHPRCWDEMKCERTDCPAYGIKDYRCWLVAGTLCGGAPEGTFAKKHNSCISCTVYQKFTDTPLNALYENVGIVIQHLGDVTRQLRWLAINDGLTGLYNRTYLKLIRKREVATAERGSSPLSLIIFDLDGFKSVNDTYGHLAGDEMLRVFARFLQKYTRKADIIFRLGGDEFMVLMSDTEEGHRSQAEKRYLDDIAEWNQGMKETLPVPISFTLGGATASAPINFNELMAEADKVLYANKVAKKLPGHLAVIDDDA
jgi:diguanylate cyclase (GGDEF)-like protein